MCAGAAVVKPDSDTAAGAPPRRRAWITGASSGLGAALARTYVAQGWQVALTARPGPRLDAIAAELGGAAVSRPADVTDAAELGAAITANARDGVPPDLVILNAGTYVPLSAADFDSATVENLFAVNVFSVTRALALLLPGMRARGHGHIALMGSVAADIGLPYAAPYSASKAALVRLWQSLRPELEGFGIRLTLIEPGFVATPLTARNDFPMPFLVSAENAAALIYGRLERGDARIRFPRAMSFGMRLLANLPECLSLPLRRRMLRR